MKSMLWLFLIFLFSAVQVNSQETDFEKLMKEDWANLQKYREDNERMGDSKNDLVVFMGNSITEGWINSQPEFFSKNNYVGRGISGQTTPQMLVRFVPDVIDLNPAAVVILAGTNDIAGNTGYSSVKMITDNIKAMSQLAAANDIKVILGSVLPVHHYPWREQIRPIEVISEVNDWLQDYAREHGHTYADFYAEMVDERKGLKSELSGDGVHPDDKGYAVMEPVVREAISEALSKN